VIVIRSLVLLALAAVGLVALVALCVRVAGGPDAWKVGLGLVASLPLVGFATRTRDK
jgi:hypothetical protein